MTMFVLMFKHVQKALYSLLALPRLSKSIIVIVVDISLCVLTVWLAYYLRLGEFISLSGGTFWAVAVSIFLVLPIFAVFGLYRIIFRYSGWQSMYTVFTATAVYGLLYASVITFVGIAGIPRTIGLIQPLLLFFVVVCFRTFARHFLDGIFRAQRKIEIIPKALVYGAGNAGRQLVSALENSFEMVVAGFLDDNKLLHGQLLNGQSIFSPDDLSNLIHSKGVTHVLLAIPSANKRRQNEILKTISQYNVAVRTLPSVADLADGRVTTSDLRDMDIEDLLNREEVKPNYNLLVKNITAKVVLVTGSGGSIGGELCRQIIELKPKKLLLLEISEFALYVIHTEIENILGVLKTQDSPIVVPLLASVQDKNRMRKIMDTWQPDTVYHAAAYKHVPLVEYNLIEGLKNNVIGTLTTAQVAIEKGVSDFVFISTDKAVRPTNVMGASKRLAELTLQALCDQKTKKNSHKLSSVDIGLQVASNRKTNFSMVRFGNVLGSSGSVIPRFRKQIQDGGPVTLTHLEIERYFMTIPEAAQLVIQASAMSKGGDVFVLDMGKPIKIADLARRMVELSGLSVCDKEHPDGDIEIVITGLRPGEKLYEELLLGDNPQSTMHKKIYRAQDPFIPWHELEPDIKTLKTLLSQNNVERILSLLQKLVTGYQPNKKVVDWVYSEKIEFGTRIDDLK